MKKDEWDKVLLLIKQKIDEATSEQLQEALEYLEGVQIDEAELSKTSKKRSDKDG